MGLAIRGTQRRRAHSWSRWLGHTRGAGTHRGVNPVLVGWSMATSYGYRLAGPLAVHGAASIHPQTVGHARARATVAGAGSPTVVGGPRVVS